MQTLERTGVSMSDRARSRDVEFAEYMNARQALSVLDARTGDLVAEFAPAGGNAVTLIRPAWESAGTIVATALEGNVTTMVRMGVDGTLEEVADPVEATAYGDVYYYTGDDRAVL